MEFSSKFEIWLSKMKADAGCNEVFKLKMMKTAIYVRHIDLD